MGRSLSTGGTASVQSLTNTLGCVSNTVKDSSTSVSYTGGNFGGYYFAARNASSVNTYFTRNSTGEQYIPPQRTGVLQDELSGYTYVHSRMTNSQSSAINGGAVYDADLNSVYSWSTDAPPYGGSLFCVRLHNSNLYFFSGTSANGIEINKISLPSGTKTTFNWTEVAGPWSSASQNLVFNWPVNNKFWLFVTQLTQGSYAAAFLTFDLTTETFAVFGTTRTATSTDYLDDSRAMHVKADGSAVSVVVTRYADYGVFSATSSASTYTLASASGHYQIPALGWYYWSDKTTSPWVGIVTTDAVIDSNGFRNDNATGPFRVQVPHLRGGDTSVQVTAFIGTSYGLSTSQYPIAVSSGLNIPFISTTIRNQAYLYMLSATSYGRYELSRSGNTLVIGPKISSAHTTDAATNYVASKLPDTVLVRADYQNVNAGASLWLSTLAINEGGTDVTFNFGTSISNFNEFGFGSAISHPWITSFVTSTGRMMVIPSGASGTFNQVQLLRTTLPVFTAPRTGTYKVTVIGGGGASTGTHGSSSGFSTLLAAANGANRTGFVSGSTVITSGPTRGTGGTGYGTDGWGQGEDTVSAGTHGGGSGYVTIGTTTLQAGRPYTYRAGLGPLFGKQGAVLLEEV